MQDLCRSADPGRCGAAPESGTPEAPFADALVRLTSRGWASLHALPASGGHALVGSAFEHRYRQLFGTEYLRADVTAAGGVLDSYFRPRACLARAQRLAASAFGADHTCFLTCGTTGSNVTAVDAFTGTRPAGRPLRVLADRTSHQSLHFALHRAGAEVTYAATRACGTPHGRRWLDVADLLRRHAEAEAAGHPFDLVVLTSGSYDGAILDVEGVLRALAADRAELSVLIDEAWTAAYAFHPALRRLTALAAATAVRRDLPDRRLRVVVTQSAHKSMCALRQASYLHVVGDATLVAAVEAARYRHHTTSPSLPVLASLDLARAQAQHEGQRLLDRAMRHARDLALLLSGNAVFGVGPVAGGGDPWTLPDPLVQLVECDPAAADPEGVRVRLARDYGLYVARTTAAGFVVRMHVGVTPEVLGLLVTALNDIAGPAGPGEGGTGTPAASTGFLVAYPPGIPLSVPGEPAPAPGATADAPPRGAELFSV